MKRALEIFVSAWAMLLWSVLATLPTGSTLSLPISFGSEAFAVQPDEVLSDPELERRARAISAGLRCLVCQNQSIDDSDAGLARDLRIVVRDRLKAGDSDAAVIDYVVARYGEFVLLRPRFETSTLLLWGAPVLLLLLGGAYVLVAARSGRPVARAAELSAEEERRIERLLSERRQPGPASADDGIPSA